MMNKKWDIVKKIIDKWDPIDLLPMAPKDEYDSEIEEIMKLLENEEMTVESLASGIHDIFIDNFDEQVFHESYDDCNVIAQKILISINENAGN